MILTLDSSPLVSYAITCGIGACVILFSWFWTANTLAGGKAPRLDGENWWYFAVDFVALLAMNVFFLWNSRNDGFVHPSSLWWRSPDYWILVFLATFVDTCSFISVYINTDEDEKLV
jgi:hypothetical protein